MSWHGYASGGMPDYHPAALAGVWAKMRRAAHYAELEAAADAYVALPPYLITEDGGVSTALIHVKGRTGG